ncbi:MAG: stage II sporulation protein P [Ruminococcus sp.]|jgi:stage II sporulation protein P|nr:stage II sporulation protein P [Ruminococcus sp.]
MRGRKGFQRVLMCGMALLTLPFFYVSVKYKLPAAEKALFFAAENSANLALATMYPPVTTVFETEAAIAALGEAAPTKTKTLKITTDDSEMLSQAELRVMPSSEDEEGFVPDPPPAQNSENGDFDNPSGELDGLVREITYGEMSGTNYINLPSGGQIRNLTDIKNTEIEEIIKNAGDFKLKADGTPEVLIYHTHATECYLPDGTGNRYDTNFSFRSSDRSINMVSVGNAIEKELEAAGIGVIHDETLYDEESYNGSYEKSRAGVKKILDENPSIKLVLDVHRDAIIPNDGEIAGAIAEINGRKAAQIMIISNCSGDTLKYPIPDFRENLKAAAAILGSLEETAEGISRPILFDYRQYNQDLSKGALLIEVGSHGNTQSEAVYSGELIGKAIASLAG